MCAHSEKMKYMEALFMEELFCSQAFERFILGVLNHKGSPRWASPPEINEKVEDGRSETYEFNARDCV